MRAKSTLEKAVKFVNNCKFIFSFKKNIFRKNIFFILFFVTTISFAKIENVDACLNQLEYSEYDSKSSYFEDAVTELPFSVSFYSSKFRLSPMSLAI